jgi:hypothetical protein
MTIDEFGSVIKFTEILQLVTTGNDCIPAVLHTSQLTTEHTRSSRSVKFFTSRCLVAAPNSGLSASPGIPNCPRPQLPASNSNSSKQLHPSDYLNTTPSLSCL